MNLHSSHDRQILPTAPDVYGSNKFSADERKKSHLQGEGEPVLSILTRAAEAPSLLSSCFG